MSQTYRAPKATEIIIGGRTRFVRGDMNFAQVLFAQRGAGWQRWLGERFVGEAVDLKPGPDGKARKARRLEPISPGEAIETLYALLATDREDQGIEETVGSLGRSIDVPSLGELHVTLFRCVLAGLGLSDVMVDAVTSVAGSGGVE